MPRSNKKDKIFIHWFGITLSRNFLKVIIAIIFIILFIIALNKNSDFSRAFRGYIIQISYNVSSAFSYILGLEPIFDKVIEGSELQMLYKENELLKAKLKELEIFGKENEDLKKSLNIKQKNKNFISSSYISKASLDYESETFLIKIEDVTKISEDDTMYVTDENNALVGKIINVSSNIGRVEATISKDVKTPVYMVDSKQHGIALGRGILNSDMQLIYIEDPSKLIEGENVVTTGFGGVYPENLIVGNVNRLDEGVYIVKPSYSIYKLRFVNIFK